MIWNLLISWFFDALDVLVNYIPELPYAPVSGVREGVEFLTKNLGYFLPISRLIKLFELWLSYMSFRIGVTFYRHNIKMNRFRNF